MVAGTVPHDAVYRAGVESPTMYIGVGTIVIVLLVVLAIYLIRRVR
jgi:hypothetical protein